MAARALMTTSSAARGAVPAVSSKLESWLSEIQLRPSMGAWPVAPTTCPFWSSETPERSTTPTASATPDTFWTRASTDSGSGRFWLSRRPDGVAGVAPFTCTATPLSTLLRTPSKVLRMVSVSTSVPATKVTPRMMAIAVRASRSLWLSRLRRLTLSIRPSPAPAATGSTQLRTPAQSPR